MKVTPVKSNIILSLSVVNSNVFLNSVENTVDW